MNQAVFLSYASQDAEAAERIGEALRAAGVEVWFDRNELVGGDAWDAKIRRQIKECGLFVPIISANTQARAEGYFRLEWHLAEQRTYLMAHDQPFILPVVVDETPDAAARVPERFRERQWTRLPGGETPAAFGERVRCLLHGDAPVATGRVPPSLPANRPASRSGFPRILRLLFLPGVLLLLAGGGLLLKRGRDETTLTPEWGVSAASNSSSPVTAPGDNNRPPNEEGPGGTRTKAPPAEPLSLESISGKSIAVLPFTNMSEDKDNAFFADGIHEDILTNLALVRDLRVVSRTSVMAYRGTTKPMRQIAEELGVAYLLEGSVRRAGNKVRVTGQLIRAATDEHVWARTYDRDLTDVFAIQSELSQQIAAALQTALSPEEMRLIESRPTENVAAYDAYAKARQLLQTGNLAGFSNLEPLLKTAVLLDPKFAQAWAELASVHARLYFDGVDHTEARLAQAKAAIDTAVGLAPDDPVVIQKLGDYHYYGHRDFGRAAEQYRRLAGLYPNSAPAFASLAFIHRRQGRWSEAMEELRRAVRLEPRNARYAAALVETAGALRRYDEAEAVQRQLVSQVPENFSQSVTLGFIAFLARGSLQEIEAKFAELAADPRNASRLPFLRIRLANLKGEVETWMDLVRQQRAKAKPGAAAWSSEVEDAWVFWLHGEKVEARRLVEAVLPQGKAAAAGRPSTATWQSLATAYTILGDKAEALRCAQAARDLVPEAKDAWDGPDLSLNQAGTLACFGEEDRALAELERLLRTPNGANVHRLRHDPRWRSLRGDPRFEAMLADPANNAPLL